MDTIGGSPSRPLQLAPTAEAIGAEPSAANKPVARRARLSGPPNFFGLLPKQLAEILVAHGHETYRARQIFDWVYKKRVRDPEQMRNVSRSLRESLNSLVSLSLPDPVIVRPSAGGDTVKFVLRLADGARIESVAMRSRRGVTLCVSSQAGCGMGCGFCATGAMGLLRNLRADEIVAQVVRMLEATEWEDPGYNLVFMGMGEPLANYAPVLHAIRILNHPSGPSVGARRITVSTVGLVPQIRRLARENLALGLAISLHATTDDARSQIVPINRRYPLDSLVEAARGFAEQVGRRVTIEYTLLAGVNDSRSDATRLAEIARRIPSKVNLIPYNPVPGMSWKRPHEGAVERFAAWLAPRAPAVTVRWSQGVDIGAACGQLGSRPAST
jgi:23S rRNA (adenine2503-C2)-methyltransferase